jgi:hypothetical protein
LASRRVAGPSCTIAPPQRSQSRVYGRRRIEARGYPAYNTALAKLRAAIAGSLAGTALSAAVMKGVFEDGVRASPGRD